MSDVLRVNGCLVSWGSHQFKINGFGRVYGLTAIDWDEKRTRAKGYGMSRAHGPRGRTNGKYEPGAVKITFHTDTWIRLLDWLKSKAKDRRSYGNVEFDALLQIVEGDIARDVAFSQLTVVTSTNKAEENPDPTMTDREFDVMRIIDNGGALYDSTQEV